MREMKDSGIEWVGLIPDSWSSVPISTAINENRTKNIFGTEKKALKYTYGTIVPKSDFDADEDSYVAGTIRNYIIANEGDIVLNGLNLNYDFVSQRIAMVRERGVITSAYIVMTPKNGVVFPSFVNYLFKAYDGCKALHNMGGGVRKILNFDEFKRYKMCFPTLDEQRRITDFLDNKCAEIDALTAHVQKEVETLQEYRRSLITEAVTKGLDPDAEMKDSGIAWIGKIPQNTAIGRIKNGYHIVLGKMVNKGNDSIDGDNYLCAANLKWNGVNTDINRKMVFTENEKRLYLLRDKDVLIMEGGATAGTTCVYHDELSPCYIQNSVIRCRPKNGFVDVFLYYWMVAISSLGYVDQVKSVATMPHFTKEKVAATPLVMFPYEDQKHIVNYLDDKCAEINSIIEVKQKQLDTLAEYRKSLIYEYVTGKKEVV